MLTGFQLAKVVNVKLVELGFDEIPPQMIYNYMKQGRIEFVVIGTDKNGKAIKRIELDEAKRFVREFVSDKRSGSNSMAELLKQFDMDEED